MGVFLINHGWYAYNKLTCPLEFTLKFTRFIILTYRALKSIVHRFVPFPFREFEWGITSNLTRSWDSVLSVYFGWGYLINQIFGLIPFCIDSVFIVGRGITKCHGNQSFPSRLLHGYLCLWFSFWFQYSRCNPLLSIRKMHKKKAKNFTNTFDGKCAIIISVGVSKEFSTPFYYTYIYKRKAAVLCERPLFCVKNFLIKDFLLCNPW